MTLAQYIFERLKVNGSDNVIGNHHDIPAPQIRIEHAGTPHKAVADKNRVASVREVYIYRDHDRRCSGW
jgi:hypothetical protein